MNWKFWKKQTKFPEATITLSRHEELIRENGTELNHTIKALESEVRTKHNYIGELMRQLETVSQASLKIERKEKDKNEAEPFHGDDTPTLVAFNTKQRESVLKITEDIDKTANGRDVGGTTHRYLHILAQNIRNVLEVSDVFK